MAQVVLDGHAVALRSRIRELSHAIHEAAVTALGWPTDKRFQRFVRSTQTASWRPRTAARATPSSKYR